MKSLALAASAAALCGIAAATSADIIAEWTFEVSIPVNAGPHQAEGGVYAATSFARGSHASSATVYSNPVGNGSLESFSANNWTIGDFYQFSTSTADYEDISIQWDQTASNTGPRDFGLFVSTDGVNFNQIGGTLMVLPNAAPNPVWNSTTRDPMYQFGPFGLSSAYDDQAVLVFRLVMLTDVSANGGTVGTAGTNRVDNVIVNGTLIPTPGAAALFGLAGLVAMRRRR